MPDWWEPVECCCAGFTVHALLCVCIFPTLGELESITGSQILYHSRLTRAKLEGLHKPTLYDTGRGTSLETESGSSEPQVKDSGNDTGLSSSSNQTLYNMDDILSKVYRQPYTISFPLPQLELKLSHISNTYGKRGLLSLAISHIPLNRTYAWLV